MSRLAGRNTYARMAAVVLAGVVAIGIVSAVAGAQDTVGQSPVVGGYSQAVLDETEPSPPPSAAVRPEVRERPAVQRVARHVERGTLPFTGGQLALLALSAVGLMGLGVALRRAAAPA